MEEDLAAAKDLMSERRFGDAARLLSGICRSGSAPRDAWTMLGICLVAEEKHRELFALIELRQRQESDGLDLFHDSLWLAIDLAGRSPVLKTIAETPRNSLLYIPALFVSGAIAACDGEADRGIAEMKLASEAAGSFMEHFGKKDSYLQHVLVDGHILEGSQRMAEIEATARNALFDVYAKLQERIEFRSAPARAPQAPFVFFSACDQRHLDRFGAMVTQALDRTNSPTVFHLHIVDPSPRIGAQIAELQSRCSTIDLQYSIERCRDDSAQGWPRACYYSCSRLVRLPEILAHYGRDVFMWDIDIETVLGLDRLVEGMDGYDLGYFERKYTVPTLLCAMGAVYFANSPATRRLADLVCKFILSKLQRASFWTLDQAAIFCASRYIQARCPEFRINDFARSLGVTYQDIVSDAGSLEEKRRMRETAGRAVA
jgi:hypothetical protein